jgi:translocator protein
MAEREDLAEQFGGEDLVRPLAVASFPMTAALLILLVMVAVGALLNPSREQFAWFIRLRRPAWLSFEGLIPLIWIAIYACFYASALLAWNASWSWGLMAGYLGLLVLVQSYTWLICRTRRLANGTAVGLAGWMWGVALAIVVLPQSGPAVLLLIPYLLWSPVGTLVTWQMQRLNR